MTEQQLIDQLERTNFKGLKSIKLREDPLLHQLLRQNPTPAFTVFYQKQHNVYERTFTSHEHQNFKTALKEFELLKSFNALWLYEHTWGRETFYSRVLQALLEVLIRGLKVKDGFEEAWYVARGLIEAIDNNERNHTVICFADFPICLCKTCFNLNRTEFILHLPSYLHSRRSIKKHIKSNSWPTEKLTSVQ
jgi:hypothetical protein